jgi:CDP-paratose 2-epimerase
MSTNRADLCLITGGAGFIGAILANRLLAGGGRVRILDDLSRPGVDKNLDWLRRTHGDHLEVIVADVRDATSVREALAGVRHVYHLAAQVAVTTSLTDPLHDFDVNARGTLVLLEAIRSTPSRPSLLFTSTNKVYGALDDIALRRRGSRYEPDDQEIAARGVSEARPLEFHSPYGCSKGTADQYVLDYARTFGIAAVVFRMSCIYGPRQFGNEDQGWVAHFLIRAARGEPLRLYGDGRQVRDILFVDDLLDAFAAATDRIHEVSGAAFNIGGGPDNSVSLVDLLGRIESLTGKRLSVGFEPWRVADQRYYVSDNRAFSSRTNWAPRIGVDAGLERLALWVDQLVEQPEPSPPMTEVQP